MTSDRTAGGFADDSLVAYRPADPSLATEGLDGLPPRINGLGSDAFRSDVGSADQHSDNRSDNRVREIPLTRGFVALVDEEDYPQVSRFRWRAVRSRRSRSWYAVRGHAWRGGQVWMHRQIMAAPDHLRVDHRDGDGLRNLRENLRLATPRQNQQNRRRLQAEKTSRFLGVSKRSDCDRWRAQITAGDPVPRKLHLGSFASEEDAARARDAAAKLYFGDFASLNFPDSEPDAVGEVFEYQLLSGFGPIVVPAGWELASDRCARYATAEMRLVELGEPATPWHEEYRRALTQEGSAA